MEALEAQAQRLMGTFVRAGYEQIAPTIIQPAGLFLDVIGEALRARTYVFTDPDGEELCLRPDLTVPTCRLHLARHPAGGVPARYCYNGPAFRYQPGGATGVSSLSSRCGSMNGAPTTSNGNVVPRPSERLVPSSNTPPG